MVTPVTSINTGPLLHCFGCELIPWSEALPCERPWWQTRHSVIPWIVFFGRSIVCRESKSTSRVTVYASKNKMRPLLWQKWFNEINLLSGSWLITLRNGSILGAQCWSLLLSDWALSGRSQLSPRTTSIFATMATLSSLSN